MVEEEVKKTAAFRAVNWYGNVPLGDDREPFPEPEPAAPPVKRKRKATANAAEAEGEEGNETVKKGGKRAMKSDAKDDSAPPTKRQATIAAKKNAAKEPAMPTERQAKIAAKRSAERVEAEEEIDTSPEMTRPTKNKGKQAAVIEEDDSPPEARKEVNKRGKKANADKEESGLSPLPNLHLKNTKSKPTAAFNGEVSDTSLPTPLAKAVKKRATKKPATGAKEASPTEAEVEDTMMGGKNPTPPKGVKEKSRKQNVFNSEDDDAPAPAVPAEIANKRATKTTAAVDEAASPAEADTEDMMGGNESRSIGRPKRKSKQQVAAEEAEFADLEPTSPVKKASTRATKKTAITSKSATKEEAETKEMTMSGKDVVAEKDAHAIKKREKNTEAARKTRAKRAQTLKDLQQEKKDLEEENKKLREAKDAK